MDPKVQIGIQLASTLAALYVPQAGPAVTGLAAVVAAVQQYNQLAGQPADYVPSREEIDAFIASREARRIPGA